MIENLLSNKETFQKKKDNAVKAPVSPAWLSPDSGAASPFYNQLWGVVRMRGGGGNSQQLADTAVVSQLLMTSGLSTDTLGFIWSLANRTVPGQLTQAELYVVLALVSLAQGGYIFNDTTILNQIPQPPIPKLDLSILPQYNMNYTSHSTGIPGNYLHQSTPPAIDSTTPAAKDSTPTPLSIVSLDVNKLQGAPVLTLPNYNFGPYQGFDAAGAVITNTAHAQGSGVASVYQEPASVIPSISLGLSTPTKVNYNSSVLDRDSTTSTTNTEHSSDVASFNSINKFKLDSPTKLPSLSQPVDVSSSFSNLSLKSSGEKKKKARRDSGSKPGKTSNIDDSFDSLSTERASVNPIPNQSKPNYNLDLFELSGDVHHVFPNSGPGEGMKITEKQNHDDFDDEFTDFQSAEFTTFNAAASVRETLKPVEDLLSSQPDLVTGIEPDLKTFSTTIQPESSLTSRDLNSFSAIQPDLSLKTKFEPDLRDWSTVVIQPDLSLMTSEPSLNSRFELELSSIEPDLRSGFLTELKQQNSRNESDLNLIEPGLSLLMKPEVPTTKIDVVEDDDDFTNFQGAVPNGVFSEEDLFPKTITITAPNGTRNVDNGSLHEKSETNFSEWSDNTSNDWTVGSGGNKSDKDGDSLNYANEKDGDSLNYVDLSDIKLEIPSSDTEEVVIKKDSDREEVAVIQKESEKEDRYSALRGLQPLEDVVNASDDFGDFLAAEPGDEYHVREMDTNNCTVQIRCLEACLQILQESYSILSSASSPKVLSEVMSDPRTTNHLTCLLEVFRVSERLIKHVDNNEIVSQIQTTWNDIVPLLEGSKCYQLEDTAGPVCELCRCDYGPFPVKYGRSTFHAACANLYLHYVDSTLPNTDAY
ncbi:uncharacterized protein LOC111052564 isoform X2 [Nilaparvata lugens]|nr:uncharacterized protein LOC111052564 isoform X2 [Nilaparvata lugens]